MGIAGMGFGAVRQPDGVDQHRQEPRRTDGRYEQFRPVAELIPDNINIRDHPTHCLIPAISRRDQGFRGVHPARLLGLQTTFDRVRHESALSGRGHRQRRGRTAVPSGNDIGSRSSARARCSLAAGSKRLPRRALPTTPAPAWDELRTRAGREGFRRLERRDKAVLAIQSSGAAIAGTAQPQTQGSLSALRLSKTPTPKGKSVGSMDSPAFHRPRHSRHHQVASGRLSGP